MRQMNRVNILSTLLVIPLLLFAWQEDSCRSNKVDKPAKKNQRVVAGIWGGQHITLNVAEDGATAAMDCAHGTISQPLEIDDAGHFDVRGTFTAEAPGPVRSGGNDSRTV